MSFSSLTFSHCHIWHELEFGGYVPCFVEIVTYRGLYSSLQAFISKFFFPTECQITRLSPRESYRETKFSCRNQMKYCFLFHFFFSYMHHFFIPLSLFSVFAYQSTSLFVTLSLSLHPFSLSLYSIFISLALYPYLSVSISIPPHHYKNRYIVSILLACWQLVVLINE